MRGEARTSEAANVAGQQLGIAGRPEPVHDVTGAKVSVRVGLVSSGEDTDAMMMGMGARRPSWSVTARKRKTCSGPSHSSFSRTPTFHDVYTTSSSED